MVSVLGMLPAPLELYCTLSPCSVYRVAELHGLCPLFSGLGLSLTNDSHQLEVRR